MLIVTLAKAGANPVVNENETIFQKESFFDVQTTLVNETSTAGDSLVNDTAFVKADVPYIPYDLHNYTDIFGDDESSGGRNGTKKEIIRQDYDFQSW